MSNWLCIPYPILQRLHWKKTPVSAARDTDQCSSFISFMRWTLRWVFQYSIVKCNCGLWPTNDEIGKDTSRCYCYICFFLILTRSTVHNFRVLVAVAEAWVFTTLSNIQDGACLIGFWIRFCVAWFFQFFSFLFTISTWKEEKLQISAKILVEG